MSDLSNEKRTRTTNFIARYTLIFGSLIVTAGVVAVFLTIDMATAILTAGSGIIGAGQVAKVARNMKPPMGGP